MEDEHHALFVCGAHHGIRLNFEGRLKWTSVAEILNPTTEEDMNIVGKYLKNMYILDMCQ